MMVGAPLQTAAKQDPAYIEVCGAHLALPRCPEPTAPPSPSPACHAPLHCPLPPSLSPRQLMELGVRRTALRITDVRGFAAQELDEYIEQLYEDSAEVKTKATAKIAQLFRGADNLEILLSHEALLGVRPPSPPLPLSAQGHVRAQRCNCIAFV